MDKENKVIDGDIDFMSEMQDVVQLKPDDKVFLKQTDKNALSKSLKRERIGQEINTAKNYLTLEDISPLDPHTILEFKQDGVQDGVFKNLRLGKYKLEYQVNLTHLKLEQAHQLVFETVVQSHKKGMRAIIFKHGLSLGKKPFDGFLKSYLNTWLYQMPEVIAYHSAQPQHGGSGSTYVLLKKNDKQKQHNRELHKQR